MNILETKYLLESISVFVGICVAVLPLIKMMRKRSALKKEEHLHNIEVRNNHAKISKETLEKLTDVDIRLKNVEDEIMWEGEGSVKNFLNTIKTELDATTWVNPRPMFRITSNGNMIFVNDAYTKICGCRSDELLNFGWKNHLDGDIADELHERWNSLIAELNQFKDIMHIKSSDGIDMGQWTIVIRPLGPITIEKKFLDDSSAISRRDVSEYVCHGVLKPRDAIAHEVAARFGIPK